MKNINKIIIIAVVAALSAVGLVAVYKTSKHADVRESKKIRVVTTLFPLYDMARATGGDLAEVSLLLPPGVEAHSFEPKPSDILKINRADIFIYTGKSMEPWVDDILKASANKNLIVVDGSSGVKTIAEVSYDSDSSSKTFDPHIWLDFDNAKMMLSGIKNAFIKRDPSNAYVYQKNYDAYNNQLSDLDSEYRSGLLNCENKEIVYGGHYAFGYLANRYGLRYLAAQGISPDSEPTVNDLSNLVREVRVNNIKYIFYEELTSPKIAETIASETNAKLLLLNAGHNLSKSQIDNGVSFIDILRTDLENLKIGLNCR